MAATTNPKTITCITKKNYNRRGEMFSSRPAGLEAQG